MNTTLPATVDELLDWWPGNIPSKGKLISADGCMCAQGQVLHLIGGKTPDELRAIEQAEADREVARIMGISCAHAVLLRIVNDGQPGAPTCVIREPEKVLGSEAQTVLSFWRHLDAMTADDWQRVVKARDAAWDAAWAAARDAAGDAAWDAAWDAARDAAGDAAGDAAWDAAWAAARDAARAAAGDAARAAAWASNEIQGAAIMRERGQPFFFLPMFGFASPEEIMENVK
jgi:hypothetical protein